MEKEIIIAVGPQGSGKSTLYEKRFKDYERVSQDDQGKQGHKSVLLNALKQGKNIYVDRINHTREQRNQYINPARERGYKVKIVLLQEDYVTCYERIKQRKDHPTLKIESAHDALSMYFFQYQAPKASEADSIEVIGEDKQFLFDISQYVKDRRVIVIGDLHGMADELELLLKKCSYMPGYDVLLFVGDLVDRGPKIDQTLMKYVDTDEHWAYSVMGNHEYKFVRYLLGRKVSPKSLQETIDQTSKFKKDDMIKQIMSMPYCIKFRENSFVVHAGINPLKDVTNQYKDELMYTRNVTMSGVSAPWWTYYYGDKEIFFGHEVTPEKTQVSEKVFAMDGGACFGMELRACISNPDGTKEFVTQKCTKAYADYKEDWSEEKVEESVQIGLDQAAQERFAVNPMSTDIKKREDLIKEGFLNRKTYKDLFLYNYTPKCTYEKMWNETTRNSRGIIFDSVTGEVVSWTPEKFFNVNEMPETILENLPMKGGFEVFEKVDGSFISLSFWKRGNEWIFATRGSFESEQAQHARLMMVFHDQPEAFERLNKDYSYVFEVLYPENRHNEGARLVVDYGSERTLVGLAIYDKLEKKELSYEDCVEEFKKVGFRTAKKFEGLDLDKLVELQKTLPSQQEGFVVKFSNGLRVKFKTEAYVQMNKILNSMNIKTVWESMVDGKIPDAYMMTVPEEVREEAERYKADLEKRFSEILNRAIFELHQLPVQPVDEKDAEAYKKIGLFMKDNSSKFTYPVLVFPIVRGKVKETLLKIKNLIEPKLGV